MFKIPIVFHFRNQGAEALGKSKMLHRLMKYSFKKGHFICLSKSAVNDVENYIDKSNLYIVNNGIEIFSTKFEKTSDEPNAFKLFFLSNLRHEKGVYTLLEVYEKLQQSLQIKLELNIVGEEGDISYHELTTDITSRNLKNVHVLGPKYGNEKLKAFAKSDLFIFPSRNEVFPGVVLEAMQLGLPIVTTNVGAIPDIIETNHNGIVCEKDDVSALAAAVTKIVENPEFSQRLANQARVDFHEKYTLESFEKNMLTTWKSILTRQ
jgi:glycosyltransferase involved in cell wall biosynthesis